MSFGGNGVDELGIENNDVRVTPDRNLALLRIKSKNLRCICTANGDESLEGDFTGQNPVCVEEFNTLFDTRNAIGNEGKVSRLAARLESGIEALGGIRMPHVLLCRKIKRGMIRGDSTNAAIT